MLIRTLPTTLLQIFCKINFHFKVIVKNSKDPDDNFEHLLLFFRRLMMMMRCPQGIQQERRRRRRRRSKDQAPSKM